MRKSTSIMPDYEDRTAFLGEWGPFQKKIFFILCLSVIPNGFAGLSIVFIGDSPSHRCLVPTNANLTAEWNNFSIPMVNIGGTFALSKCSRYKLDVIKKLSDRGLIPGIDINMSNIQKEGCLDGWEYDDSVYISTIVTEWDLVCNESWKVPMTSSVFFTGVLTGSFISGQLSDRFGRKRVLFANIAVQAVFTFIQVFSPSWVVFCAMFFIVGMGHISNYVAAFVLGTEIFNRNVRTIFSTAGVSLSFGVGYMLLPLIAYHIRDWRTLLLVLSVPSFLCVPFWWFIPESPRWLLSQGRVKEAEDVLRHAAKKNREEPPPIIFSHSQIDLKPLQIERHNICDLVRFSNIRWTSVTLWLVWNVVSIAYLALSLNTANLHGNAYFNCFLSAAIEMPAYAISWLMFHYCPRRHSLFSTLFLGGLVLFFIQLIPPDLTPLAIALEMMGKFGVTIAFAIIYAYSAELYPTVLRTTAVAACSMASRVGSISAPYLIYLRSYSVSLPYILIGSLTVLSGLLSLLLPESYGMPLPDTIAHMQSFPGCCKKKQTSQLSETSERRHLDGVL